MLLVYAVSASFFGEEFTGLTLLGILIALGGLFLSSRSTSTTPAGSAPRRLGWSYACAVCIAGYHLCYRQALAHEANPSWLFSLSLILAIPIMLAVQGREQRLLLKGVLRQHWQLIIIGGAVCLISFLLYLLGLKTSGAGYALVIRNLSIIFAQFFAFFIGEKISLQQWIGAVLVAIGASLV